MEIITGSTCEGGRMMIRPYKGSDHPPRSSSELPAEGGRMMIRPYERLPSEIIGIIGESGRMVIRPYDHHAPVPPALLL